MFREAVFFFTLTFGVSPLAVAQSAAAKPISRDGLLKAVEIGGLSSDELVSFIRDLGVEFKLNDQDRQLLARAGVDDKVMSAIAQNFREAKRNRDDANARVARLLTGGPLGKDEVIGLLKSGVPSDELEPVIEKRGIAFSFDGALAKELEAAGAKPALVGMMLIRQPAFVAVEMGQQSQAPVAPAPVAASNSAPALPKQVTAARLIKQQKMDYPPEARRQKIAGNVRLELTIAEDGSVEKVKVLSGHPLLTSAAETAVKGWKYQPATIDGKPSKVTSEVELAFKLSN